MRSCCGERRSGLPSTRRMTPPAPREHRRAARRVPHRSRAGREVDAGLARRRVDELHHRRAQRVDLVRDAVLEVPVLVVPARDDDAPRLRLAVGVLAGGGQRRQRLAVDAGLAASVGDDAAVDDGLVPGGQPRRAEHEFVVDEQPGRHAELRQAAQELARPVEGIDHPRRLAGHDRMLLPGLLGEPVRAGDEGREAAVQDLVGGVVGLGHRPLAPLVADAHRAAPHHRADRLARVAHGGLEGVAQPVDVGRGRHGGRGHAAPPGARADASSMRQSGARPRSLKSYASYS